MAVRRVGGEAKGPPVSKRGARGDPEERRIEHGRLSTPDRRARRRQAGKKGKGRPQSAEPAPHTSAQRRARAPHADPTPRPPQRRDAGKKEPAKKAKMRNARRADPGGVG